MRRTNDQIWVPDVMAFKWQAGLASLLLMCGVARHCFAADIWLSGLDPQWREIRHWQANDFMKLFETREGWNDIAPHINVFEISKRFARDAPEEEVKKVVEGLHRYGMKLSLQVTPLGHSDACGKGVESFGPAGEMQKVAERLRNLGAQVSYFNMDEPLYYGHFFVRRGKANGCQWHIGEVAEKAASELRRLKQIFPDAKIGDTEPFGDQNSKKTSIAIAEWCQAFRKAYGESLNFLIGDILWRRPMALDSFREAALTVKQQGTIVGIIYNGTPQAKNDEAWTNQAIDHINSVERKMNFVPDIAMFSSWTEHPTRMLPDTQPGTLTNVVRQYLLRHGKIHNER